MSKTLFAAFAAMFVISCSEGAQVGYGLNPDADTEEAGEQPLLRGGRDGSGRRGRRCR